MNKIKLLDKTVSNMIAAGEVVERPSSVIKELLENSVDAGATHITVEIKSGGVRYMRVTDNGIGMSTEDAQISLLRHATSKISVADDLDAIMTLGFRGEALSSICAVSKMEIYTKAPAETQGTNIKSEFGEIIYTNEAGCPNGTTIIVRDLFLNTPARMKFLKKDYTEAGYIADIISRLALAHPEISFKFINNDKEQLFTSGDCSLLNCILSVYGKDTKNAMLPAAYNEGGIFVSGFCGKSEASRPNRNMQNFFLNGRYIKSPLLSRALEEAYKHELMTGKFPSCVLNIKIDPHSVDINVHPTKLEVKFADEKAAYHAMYWAVKNALYQKPPTVAVSQNISGERAERIEKDLSGGILRGDTIRLNEAHPFSAMQSSAPLATPTKIDAEDLAAGAEHKTLSSESSAGTNIKAPTGDGFLQKNGPLSSGTSHQQPSYVVSSPPLKEGVSSSLKENASPSSQEKDFADIATFKQPYRICGQVFNTYIIAERDGKMLLVDQHAAHERLRFEELRRQYENRQIVAQTLLSPCIVTLTSSELSAFREYENQINELGFDAEVFGESDVIIRSAPEELTGDELSDLIIRIIGLFSGSHKNVDTTIAEKMLYQIACKGAIKANRRLHESEMKTLLDNIFKLSEINTCPHGRPITIEITKEFLEKQFKRIV